jgi:hypothetical protein
LSRLLLVAAFALVFTACSRNDPPSTPPTAPPTATSTTGPRAPTAADQCTAPAGLCNRAAAITKALLVNHDYDWLVQNYPPRDYDCSGVQQPPPLCQGASPGELRKAFRLADSQAGATTTPVSVIEYVRLLREWLEAPLASRGDAYGPPQPALYSIGCAELPPPPRPICESQFVFVFSKLPANAPRSYFIFFIGLADAGDVLQPLTTYVGPLDDPAATDPIIYGATTQWPFRPGPAWTFFRLLMPP